MDIKLFCMRILHLFLLAWMVMSIQASGATPDEVAQAAAKGLPELLAKIPAGAWRDYGFADASEVAKATLDRPLCLYTITPAALAGYQSGESIRSLLSDTTMWYVPVKVADSVRAILVVDRLDGAWQAVSLGYVPLAGPMQALIAQWPPAKGFHPKLILVFQAQQYLFTIPELGEDNLTRLGVQGAGSEYRAGPFRVGRVDETVSFLKPMVANNLAGR